MSRINRRDFMLMVGAGGVGAGAGFVAAEASKRPREQYIPYVVTPEDYSPGIATWYNSVCGQCSAGCGISVRIREGRAKKIEGNPLHPVNQGRLCGLGQAGLQSLYNPDRLRHPMLRRGDALEAVSWDEALQSLAARVGAGGNTRLLSGPVRGHLGELLARLMTQLGADGGLQYDPAAPAALYAANRIAFGTDALPYYDIGNADYVVSLGADFLGTWVSPVHHSLAYGQLRQGEGRKRGHVVQVEPRMSLTGANADEWLPARPGTEGLIALAIAGQILASGRYRGEDADKWQRALAAWPLAEVAERTGVAAGKIGAVAKAFAASRRPLAIGGGSAAACNNGVPNMLAVAALNLIAGNVGRPGGMLVNPAPALGNLPAPARGSAGDVLELLADCRAGQVDTLIVHASNPVHSLPAAAGGAQALSATGMLVSLSEFMDETTAQADLVLPLHNYLESWWDDVPEPGVGFPVASIGQPVVSPLYDTRSAGDIVLGLAAKMGGAAAAELPWPDMKSFLMARWGALYAARRERIDEPDFASFWNAVLQAGVWGEEGSPGSAAQVDVDALRASLSWVSSPPAADDAEYPFAFHAYPSIGLHDGRGANLPWMQELPDPLTSVVYQSWVEINPATADELDIEDGDELEVSSPSGSVTALAFRYPAIRPDVIAMPLGQGHSEYGRYAAGRGVNAIDLLAPEVESASGAIAEDRTRVRIAKTGRKASLPKTDGRRDTLGRPILGPHGGGGHDG